MRSACRLVSGKARRNVSERRQWVVALRPFSRPAAARTKEPEQTEQVRRVRCMSILLGQCGTFLKDHGLATLNWTDNAAAAREVAALGDPAEAALASELAGEIYGLDILARQIEDQSNNTTRFLVMSREADHSRRGSGMMTTFTFRVRNIPAALYKAMGGFATNGVNMTKLESYMVGGSFTATEFYADVEGHPEDPAVRRALEELAYFTSQVEILGVYPADRGRGQARRNSLPQVFPGPI